MLFVDLYEAIFYVFYQMIAINFDGVVQATVNAIVSMRHYGATTSGYFLSYCI